ncbi:hypothetical protein ACFGWY_04465 [Pasteurella multocida]
MAFTEHTFSLLRESVKQSMLDDKQKGLPTGELLAFKPDTRNVVRHVNRMFSDVRYYEFDDTRAEAESWIENNLELLDAEVVEGGDVTLTVTKKGEKPVTKKGIKLGRALKWLFPELSDGDIKRKVTQTTTKYKPMYVMFTDRFIHKHYRVLSVTQSLNSCMAKRPSYYGLIRQDTCEDDPEWERYIYPTEPYNNSPNLRLALITHHHPDSKEFNKEGQYPFVARAIVMVKGKNRLSYQRVYGIENAQEILGSVGIERSGTEGGKLNIIYDEADNIVAPYVDPHNSLELYEDYIEIDVGGAYEIEHNRAVLYKKYHCFCDHCNEYHDNDEEDEHISVSGVGTVYGDCREDYFEAIGRTGYFHIDDLYYSDYHDEHVHEDDAIEYISTTSSYTTTDYIHEGWLSDAGVVRLCESYNDVDYAREYLCVETVDGEFFLNYQQSDMYFKFGGDYYSVDDSYWSDTMDCYIPIGEAVKHKNDWVTQEYLNNLEQEELEDAA